MSYSVSVCVCVCLCVFVCVYVCVCKCVCKQDIDSIECPSQFIMQRLNACMQDTVCRFKWLLHLSSMGLVEAKGIGCVSDSKVIHQSLHQCSLCRWRQTVRSMPFIRVPLTIIGLVD